MAEIFVLRAHPMLVPDDLDSLKSRLDMVSFCGWRPDEPITIFSHSDPKHFIDRAKHIVPEDEAIEMMEALLRGLVVEFPGEYTQIALSNLGIPM
jgi:hypothetical protein